MHPRLLRLDALASSLARAGDVLAVLGLGSAGMEHHRFDDHSDIDFFVITSDSAAKGRYLADTNWLAALGDVVYEFAHDANGQKVLFDDGLFVEYAIFTVEGLRDIPFVGARIVWQRPGCDLDLSDRGSGDDGNSDTVDVHLNECLANLFVGLNREIRGERLAASRFIQVFAVDQVLALVRLTNPGHAGSRDPFDHTRRVESDCPALRPELALMVQGYDHNVAAARAILSYLTSHFEPHPAIAARIRFLLAEAVAP